MVDSCQLNAPTVSICAVYEPRRLAPPVHALTPQPAAARICLPVSLDHIVDNINIFDGRGQEYVTKMSAKTSVVGSITLKWSNDIMLRMSLSRQ